MKRVIIYIIHCPISLWFHIWKTKRTVKYLWSGDNLVDIGTLICILAYAEVWMHSQSLIDPETDKYYLKFMFGTRSNLKHHILYVFLHVFSISSPCRAHLNPQIISNKWLRPYEYLLGALHCIMRVPFIKVALNQEGAHYLSDINIENNVHK